MSDKRKRDLYLFFIVVVAVNLALGFSDGLFSNYFKDVYNVDGRLRGLIEFPREIPGVIVFFLVSALMPLFSVYKSSIPNLVGRKI